MRATILSFIAQLKRDVEDIDLVLQIRWEGQVDVKRPR